ncbi:MAG TPA: pitrilysin family protein, partial [Candidatus Deferrimicrobiaceae bacterium]|nr:pitrilysin family protein [Candidatus Deferrimicrobiaceae bacterium]
MTGFRRGKILAVGFGWAAAVLLGAAASGAETAGGTTAAGGGKLIEKFTLGNGLTVVLRENHSSPVVAVQVWVKAGSATEPEKSAGMSHILEHMAFKGTKQRGPGQIAREVEALGGEINAYTSFDQTVYHITISGRFLGNALDILADTLGNSVFDEGELEREKEVVIEELRRSEDNPGRVNGKAMFREAYRVHPYGRPVIGYDNTIRKITRDDLLAYFARYYYPGNMVLVITGDVDPGKARPLIEKAFLPLATHAAPPDRVPPEPPQRETRVRVQERNAKRAYLDIGFHGPSVRDEEVFAWDLLGMILGGGQTSRLYHEVKDVRGLVDSVSSYAYTPKDPGVLIVSATAASEKAKEALREILFQTFRLAAALPEGQELARAKTSTESDFVYSLESQGQLARHVGFFETTLDDGGFEQKYIQKIRAVTAGDIVAVARKYLKPDNLTVAAVVPDGEGDLIPGGEIPKIAAEAYREAMREAGGEE